nr:hypothetical protein [Tanacetum cinerariifolium]
RYIDTKPNHELIRYCLENPPYKLDWKDVKVLVSEGSPITTTARIRKTYKNVSQEIRDQLNAEAEAVQIILTGIDNQQSMLVRMHVRCGKQLKEPSMVAEDDETSKDKEIDKLMDLISLSFKKIYKPTNNNLLTSSNTSRANQDNSPRINKNTREKMLLCKQEEAGIQLNAQQVDWRDDTDDDELEDQELEAHYMYMAQLQEVSPDVADFGPIFDDEPLQKVSNEDHYNVFTMESTHPEQSKSVHDTYPIEQDAQNVIIDSLDMINDKEEIDQNDDDNDLAKEQANNKLFETNNLLYADYKKSEAELARRNSKEYALQMELESAKVKGDLLSYKMDYHKSCNKYTETINALNQTISEMKDKLSAH